MAKENKPYETPSIIFEGIVSTRAGSPVSNNKGNKGAEPFFTSDVLKERGPNNPFPANEASDATREALQTGRPVIVKKE